MPTDTLQTQQIPHEFVVEVYDEDLKDDGSIALKSLGQQIVKASSRQELIDIFKRCGQRVKIINEMIRQQPQPRQVHLDTQSGVASKQMVPNMPQERRPQGAHLTSYDNKPHYYSIGDIEIKYQAGKIYQRQWMRLTDEESRNIRIINTSTNKIVSMTGKHIELKRWVLVEQSNEQSRSVDDMILDTIKNDTTENLPR